MFNVIQFVCFDWEFEFFSLSSEDQPLFGFRCVCVCGLSSVSTLQPNKLTKLDEQNNCGRISLTVHQTVDISMWLVLRSAFVGCVFFFGFISAFRRIVQIALTPCTHYVGWLPNASRTKVIQRISFSWRMVRIHCICENFIVHRNCFFFSCVSAFTVVSAWVSESVCVRELYACGVAFFHCFFSYIAILLRVIVRFMYLCTHAVVIWLLTDCDSRNNTHTHAHTHILIHEKKEHTSFGSHLVDVRFVYSQTL